jgi:uncharacterized protein
MPPRDRPLDDDLERLTRDQLAGEVAKLRRGIREHRDSTGQELCWHHPALWGLLPEKTDPLPVVPAWPEFLHGCVRYRQSLDAQAPGAPRSDEPYQDPAPDPASSSIRAEASMMWRRVDLPGHDVCRLVRADDGWRLEGAAVFNDDARPALLAYEVDCDSRWRTTRARVRGHVGGFPIVADIASSDGAWRLDGAVVPGVGGCVDLDLGFTPATNLLSIRRLALTEGDAADVRAAWYDAGANGLQPIEQRYERRGYSTYWYESPTFKYAAELDVLPTGFVRRYPRLWEPAIE